MQWNLAHQSGFEAHEALKVARALTVELNRYQLVHFALLREFEECSERMQQRQQDDFELLWLFVAIFTGDVSFLMIIVGTIVF